MAVDYKKLYELPPRRRLEKLLLSISKDKYIRECFYSILLKEAGKKKTVLGIFMALKAALESFRQQIWTPRRAEWPHTHITAYIEVLIDDKQGRTFVLRRIQDSGLLDLSSEERIY